MFDSKLKLLTKISRRVLRTLLIAAILLTTLPATAHAQGAWEEGRCYTSVETSVDGGTTYQVASLRGIECLLANILATAVTFIGLAAFVMIIYGAFLFLTSGGSSKGTEAGKQAITYAIIGIVVALLAFWILNLISSFTGVRGILQLNLWQWVD